MIIDTVLAPDFSDKYCKVMVFSLNSLAKKSIIPHISCSVGGSLSFDFKSRNNKEMYRNLGIVLADLASQITRGGMLVFFPSYSMMSKCK